MGVIDGQDVSAAVTNPAFINKNIDDTTPSKLGLANGDPVSGTSITNLQREVNSESSFTGKAINSAKDVLPSWVNNQVGTPTDNLFDRSDALTERFDGPTGHTHDGTDGEGPMISASSIASTPLSGVFVQGTTLFAASGGSTIVTTEMSGKTPSTSMTMLGVVVNAPYNKTILRQATGAVNDEFVDGFGNEVYGRITESVGVWTLTYYVDIAGAETPYSFSSPVDIKWYFQELFNPLSVAWPVYNPGAFIPSENATADVVDATSTQRGLVSILAQTFAGVKTWVNGLILQAYLALNRLDVASAATITALSSSKSFDKLTGTTATTLQGIVAGVDGQVLVLHNGTNQTLTVANESGGATAANRIVLPGATDATVTAGSSISFIYDTGQSRWVLAASSGGSGGGALQVTGTRASPQNITAGGGIAFTGTAARQLWFIQGSGGPVDITVNPQIAAATIVGQELVLEGCHDTNTVTLEDGTGLKLKGIAVLGAYDALYLLWDGTDWCELSRNF